MTLALYSDSLPLDKIEDAADTNLAQKISQVTGVGLVSIAGGKSRPCAFRPTRPNWRLTT